jgi:hypothetical protein
MINNIVIVCNLLTVLILCQTLLLIRSSSLYRRITDINLKLTYLFRDKNLDNNRVKYLKEKETRIYAKIKKLEKWLIF